MNYVDRLNEALRLQLRQPWTQDRSGGEQVWFLIFDPDKLRTVMARKKLFQLSAEEAGKGWVEIDVSPEFGSWMASHQYADRYFARPSRAKSIPEDFVPALAATIKQQVVDLQVDDHTLLVLTGTESLFGISKLSPVVRLIEDYIPGRLLVFFPGTYTNTQYRFLDARDGWNYLAVPLVPVSGRGVA